MPSACGGEASGLTVSMPPRRLKVVAWGKVPPDNVIISSESAEKAAGFQIHALEVGADAPLVYGPSVERSAALVQWADYYYSLTCYVCKAIVLPSNPKDFREAVGVSSTQWRCTRKDQEAVRRDGSIAFLPLCMWCCTVCYQMWATVSRR